MFQSLELKHPRFYQIFRLFIVVFASILYAWNLRCFAKTAGLFPSGFSGASLLLQNIGIKFLHISVPFAVFNIGLNLFPKRMAEDLTSYMRDNDIKVKYLHSDIDTMERVEIVRDLRLGVFDVLVGINLLREGLDIPEITLVAILDADKEGFLRSETSLIQTIGRAARNVDGHVIMYADTITGSMKYALDETSRRREIQQKYNEEHGITPKTIEKSIRDLITIEVKKEELPEEDKDAESMTKKELQKVIAKLTKKMNMAAADLNFEVAAEIRDQLKVYKAALRDYDKE